MPLIIDAWNLIRNEMSAISDDGPDALGAAGELVRYFQRYQQTHGDPVVLVFDSSREHLDVESPQTAALRVVATKNADAYIKRYIDATPERQRRNVRVVSSDNEVYFYAKSSYATPIRSDEFWAKLRGIALRKKSRKMRRSDHV